MASWTDWSTWRLPFTVVSLPVAPTLTVPDVVPTFTLPYDAACLDGSVPASKEILPPLLPSCPASPARISTFPPGLAAPALPLCPCNFVTCPALPLIGRPRTKPASPPRVAAFPFTVRASPTSRVADTLPAPLTSMPPAVTVSLPFNVTSLATSKAPNTEVFADTLAMLTALAVVLPMSSGLAATVSSNCWIATSALAVSLPPLVTAPAEVTDAAATAPASTMPPAFRSRPPVVTVTFFATVSVSNSAAGFTTESAFLTVVVCVPSVRPISTPLAFTAPIAMPADVSLLSTLPVFSVTSWSTCSAPRTVVDLPTAPIVTASVWVAPMTTVPSVVPPAPPLAPPFNTRLPPWSAARLPASSRAS